MNIAALKGSREAPKSVRSSMETMIITVKEVCSWVVPAFQRPLHVNAKVRAFASELKQNGGVIGGVLTLGRLPNDQTIYIVNGQHRIEGFKISEMPEAIADVRVLHFDTMADMAEEYVNEQDVLVRMRPDDVLRGLEGTVKAIAMIRRECPFVGFDNIRRNASGSCPMVSMATVLRYWAGSRAETPVGHFSNSNTPGRYAREIDEAELAGMIGFLRAAFGAWGHEAENFKLWNGLNMGMCMWLYRRLVIQQDRSSTKRSGLVSHDQFRKCLMGLSAAPDYIDWISGRVLADVHRSACYRRIRSIFSKRIKEDTGEGIKFPQPAWFTP